MVLQAGFEEKMIVSAFMFSALYFLYFLTLIAISPGFVEQVWNLKAISGILILGIPLRNSCLPGALGLFGRVSMSILLGKKLN